MRVGKGGVKRTFMVKQEEGEGGGGGRGGKRGGGGGGEKARDKGWWVAVGEQSGQGKSRCACSRFALRSSGGDMSLSRCLRGYI